MWDTDSDPSTSPILTGKNAIPTSSITPMMKIQCPKISTPTTPAAVNQRVAWHLALGHIAIPKTVNRGRMAENLAAASIQLGAADVAAISELNENLRQGSHPDTANFD